jgi:hypothetical protein
LTPTATCCSLLNRGPRVHQAAAQQHAGRAGDRGHHRHLRTLAAYAAARLQFFGKRTINMAMVLVYPFPAIVIAIPCS